MSEVNNKFVGIHGMWIPVDSLKELDNYFESKAAVWLSGVETPSIAEKIAYDVLKHIKEGRC